MRTFNAIQIVILLMLAPTLLSMAKAATFAGAGAVFWVGSAGTFILAVFAVGLVRLGMSGVKRW